MLIVSAPFRLAQSKSFPVLSRLVTVEETWLYHYGPETKQQTMEWRHSSSPHPIKNPSAKIHWKSSRFIDYTNQHDFAVKWKIGYFNGNRCPESENDVSFVIPGLVCEQLCIFNIYSRKF
jgi:hypothetical protein